MKASTRRGHALALLLASMAAVGSLWAIVVTRLGVEVEGRRDEDARLEALWLARSAAVAGGPVDRTVALSRGPARLRVVRVERGGVVATVDYGGGRAEVTAWPGGSWEERYARAGR